VPASNITATSTISITVFNPAPGGGASNVLFFMVVIRPATMGDYKLYLPFVANNHVTTPDLVAEQVIATSYSAQVVKSGGDVPVVDEFRVDLYVNPVPVLTAVNQTWADEQSVRGIGRSATPTTLQFMLGGMFALPQGGACYRSPLGNHGSVPADHPSMPRLTRPTSKQPMARC